MAILVVNLNSSVLGFPVFGWSFSFLLVARDPVFSTFVGFKCGWKGISVVASLVSNLSCAIVFVFFESKSFFLLFGCKRFRVF